jgi:hypothetical protein
MPTAWDQFPNATQGQWDQFPASDAQPVASQPPPDDQGWMSSAWSGVKSAFTGEGRTEFPEAQEFGPAYFSRSPGADGNPPMASGAPAIMQSAISPDEEAQFDIIKKAIPGLERKQDAHGNIMLKAPGMSDFAYLNKPGLSGRDLDEFGTQTLATAPLLGWAGGARSMLGLMGRGALALPVASATQDVIAGQAGSEQGIDPERAAISGAIGAAIPAGIGVAKGISSYLGETGRRARSAIQNVQDPQAAARREVQAAFQRDFESGQLANRPARPSGWRAGAALTPAERQQATGRNQDLRVMDYGGENVAREGRKAANLSPSAKNEIMRVIGDRFETQSPRAGGLIEGEMNLARSSQMIRDDLRTQARNLRAPLYNQAYQQGASGIDTPLLDQLQRSGTFQRAMGRAERMLADQNAMPNWRQWQAQSGQGGAGPYTLAFWDQTKRALDDYAGQALRAGRNNQAATFSEMARQLREELDRVVPIYRQARSTAARFFGEEDALEAGRNFAKGQFNWRDAEQAVNRLNTAERSLFSEGFADELMQRISATSDRSNLLNRIAQSDMERNRIRIALGQQRFDQIEAFFRVENIMEKMRNAMGNSTTAQQASDMMKGYSGVNLGFNLGTLRDPAAAIIGAIAAGGRAAQLRINENVAEEIGNLLTSRDPDLFLQGLQQAARHPIIDALRAFDDMIADLTPVAVQTGVNQNFYDQAAP